METKTSYTLELRFPEFSGEWIIMHGNDLFEQISNKNHNSDLPILAITQDQGAVPREMIDYNISVTDASVASYKVVEIGDFIISLRSFQGGIEYSNYKGICSPAYIILRKKTDDVCNDFYKYFFKTKRYISELTKNLEGIRDGKMISYKQFSETKLPFPSLPEQRKIAACLSSLDNLITHTRKKVDLLKQHKKGLMQKLFPKKGSNMPELRFLEFSGDWEVKRLGEICDVYDGVHQTPNYTNSGIMFISVENITTLKSNKFISLDDFKRDFKIYPQKGDVLMTRIGNIGTANVYLDDDLLAFYVSLALIKPNKMNSFFLKYSIESFYFQHQLSQKTLHIAFPKKINKSEIQSISIFVPSLAEQRKIADCLSSIDKAIEETENKIRLLEQHKKGLMQRMFVKIR